MEKVLAWRKSNGKSPKWKKSDGKSPKMEKVLWKNSDGESAIENAESRMEKVRSGQKKSEIEKV